MVATDPALCRQLEDVIRKPSALPLPEFEKKLNQFFGNYCHRSTDSGWARDKYVRDTGPFTATLVNGEWKGTLLGTHMSVVIWYSPEMLEWLRKYRPAEGKAAADPPPVPDGAVMVKEMFREPASACRHLEPRKLFPTAGAAIMIRDRSASHDGWFWGWYGFGSQSGWAPDWPPSSATNNLPLMGFAQYCMNCHASAANNLTFASQKNIHIYRVPGKPEPGEPLHFLSQDFSTSPPSRSHHEQVVLPGDAEPRLGEPLFAPDDEVIAALRAYTQTIPTYDSVPKMPSETFDNTWVGAGDPDASDTFLTSSQCLGCHDAGSTGLQFDMTKPNPHGDGLLNLSPYATWRTSPMGLGGRDPIFFAQLASETQTFHPAIPDKVENICLGCHGIGGQRQFHIDEKARSGKCTNFTRDMVKAVPWPADNPSAKHANYGMLARDGITCTACHRMVLDPAKNAELSNAPQNACVEERQAELNRDESGFAKTFTGSFMVGAPDRLIGPFKEPVQAPMKNALGITPTHDEAIGNSAVCGTCHTVHLPVLKEVEGDGKTEVKTLAHIYEQTTYPEWAFSAFRTGYNVPGVTPDTLPFGKGSSPLSCQDCHMSAKEPDGSPTKSKIASIQEELNFPEVENGSPINLSARDGFARHTLVGLNVFLVKMAQQFPDVLGIRTQDPMLTNKGVDPLIATEQAMLDQASQETATIAVSDVRMTDDALSAKVTVTNLVGHKFPSGVGFRRAFIAFTVLDQNGETVWASGRTNAAGVIVDEGGAPLDGELWWKDDCTGYVRPGERPHQPHYQEITKQGQAQIYQELASTPPANVSELLPPRPKPVCGVKADPAGELTTSFLSICAEVKDNRLLPKGTLPLESRKEIAKALGAGEDLAIDVGATAVGDDPDYATENQTGGGGDALVYTIPLADLPSDAKPASVEATLYYQATPPFYLQDRFCTAKGADVERLRFLVSHLNLDETEAEGWKLKVVDSGKITVQR
ncbi:MAG: hypothetical protein E5X53_31320 [Mesorhizobium sp.]|nr:MAG: hypothetical protein E5X53_31320 [Mesorhizobium sp.]